MSSDFTHPSIESTDSPQATWEVTEQEIKDFTLASEPLPDVTDSENSSPPDLYSQVYLKNDGEQLLLILPSPINSGADDWADIWEQLQHRLSARERDGSEGKPVHLFAKNRLLDGRQLQEIADALTQAKLRLELVNTSRRQTAVAAAAAGYSVTQQPMLDSLASQYAEPAPGISEPLYWQSTIRSGMEIRHPGAVIVFGDVNPGGAVVAAGDIIIWGRLRGIAHAGLEGNRKCRIMALHMEPTQLRIADVVARAPEKTPAQLEPEVAYVASDGIRLTKAISFLKTHSFSTDVASWTDSE